jgi:lipoprotein-anchoring transpeptidase ErfK/SrfK
MRREIRILMAAIVVTLAAGLGACVEPQTETAGAYVAPAPAMRATPTPALTTSPTPTNEGAFSIPGAQPSVATTSNIALPNAIPNDTRIVINAPAYRMDVFDNGALVKSYLIGIGYPEFPLPTGMRMADAIIFNPTWTPPDEPWVESPGSKVKVGQKVAAGSKLNPLGLVKIPIGLPSLIHGGKSPAQLGGFASHGCVGLTNLRYVLGAYGVALEDLSENERWQVMTALDRMGRNAGGKAVPAAPLASLVEAATDPLPDITLSKRRKEGSTNRKVTRRVKGEKEIVVEITALAGKGYSAPVELDSRKTGTSSTFHSQQRNRSPLIFFCPPFFC